MKLKFFCYIIYLIGFQFSDSFSQGKVTVLDEQVNPGGIIDEIPLKPMEAVGSFYLYDDWEFGNIQLKNGAEIKNYPIKYDLKFNRMEIKTDRELKILGVDKINGFQILGKNEDYINVNNFEKSNAELGFYKVVYSGNTSLYQYDETKLIPANYVPETATGRRYDKIVKNVKYFISEGERVYEITGSKRKDLEFFKDKNAVVVQYVKDEKISFKDKEDLVKLISYYNSLK